MLTTDCHVKEAIKNYIDILTWRIRPRSRAEYWRNICDTIKSKLKVVISPHMGRCGIGQSFYPLTKCKLKDELGCDMSHLQTNFKR